MARTIRTEDGVTVQEGDRVYDYYSMEPGVIVPGTVIENGGDLWFDVKHDNGDRVILNGQRICSPAFAVSRGFPGARDAGYGVRDES